MRIIEKIDAKLEKNEPFFSFEYFPPKTQVGIHNLYDRLDRMSLLKPLWVDVTWGAGGSTSTLTTEICVNAQKYSGLETMMHLTCTNMEKKKIDRALDDARASGIRNILALRGDPPAGEERWTAVDGGFLHAADLVRYIRLKHGNYFGICVAGYPEGHLDNPDKEADLRYLKEKVDAGADMIITQLFYDVDVFLAWVDRCRAIGINCPIIPGIMPIMSYAAFRRMTSFCKTMIPSELDAALEEVKDDDNKVKELGVRVGVDMCRRLMAAGITGFHFYTLNLEKSVVDILTELELIPKEIQKPLPWMGRESKGAREEVRPIFWRNRPRSYIHRTDAWDEFPNGRWGDSNSPAFGEIEDAHLFSLYPINKEYALEQWGVPSSVDDVAKVFVNFLKGEIPTLPWAKHGISKETSVIEDRLVNINLRGILTVNSQPSVNGVKSNDPKFGWGPAKGYVYQKAYLECFVSPENLRILLEKFSQSSSLTYHAISRDGSSFTNNNDNTTTAVTWGVFHNREIIQPTVVDPDAFRVWSHEAFSLWTTWINLYEIDSAASRVLSEIRDNWFLLNVVENDYVEGDIWSPFLEE
jgi:methylenetetrahydrofolate reductase (NADPH)